MNNFRHLKICVSLIIVLSCAQLLSAQTPPTTGAQEADALYKAQKWPEAVKAYEALTKAEPLNGTAWFRLGVSLHFTRRYAEAAQASQRAVEISNSPIAMYNVASSYARLNDKEKAFEWLTKAINQGFPQLANIKQDEDFAGLRDDPRFTEVLATIERKMKPCLYTPEHKQLDFWVGEWQVQNSQTGQNVGMSSVQNILDGCVIFENWTGGLGGTGKSFNFYNPQKGKWQQTWVSNRGGVLEYTGEYKDGALRYESAGPAQSGGKVSFRLTFFNLGPDRVRQLSEQTSDEGKTWTVQYDFTYVRKNR